MDDSPTPARYVRTARAAADGPRVNALGVCPVAQRGPRPGGRLEAVDGTAAESHRASTSTASPSPSTAKLRSRGRRHFKRAVR